MKLLPAVAILALLILPQAAQAQIYNSELLVRVDEIFVALDDAMRDGCLASPNALKVEAELVLRRSGIKISDEMILQNYILVITTNGWSPPAVQNGCFGSIGLHLIGMEELIDETTAMTLAFLHGGLLTGQKPGFQQQVREFVSEGTAGLANEILKARAQ